MAYAEIGIAVFRLRPREKNPLKGSNGFKGASTDAAAVFRWWRGAPHANIGIATGAASGFWVLDVDGPEAAARLDELQARHGALPVTVEQRTGRDGGGRHLCFAWPEGCAPGEGLANSTGVIGAAPGEAKGASHIDVRADGGYIVAPPSIHPSGRAYQWQEGRSPFEMAFAPAPAWLWDMGVKPAAPAAPRGAKAPFKPRPIAQGGASAYGAAVLANAAREAASAPVGARNNTLWLKACIVGTYVAGGEIEEREAKRALIDAGRACFDAGEEKIIVSIVDRAFEKVRFQPRSAPDRDQSGAPRRPQASDRLAGASRSDHAMMDPASGELVDARALPISQRARLVALPELPSDLVEDVVSGRAGRNHPLRVGRMGGTYTRTPAWLRKRRRQGG